MEGERAGEGREVWMVEWGGGVDETGKWDGWVGEVGRIEEGVGQST